MLPLSSPGAPDVGSIYIGLANKNGRRVQQIETVTSVVSVARSVPDRWRKKGVTQV